MADSFDQIWDETPDEFDALWESTPAAQTTKEKIASGVLTAANAALLGFGEEIGAAGSALIDEAGEAVGLREPTPYAQNTKPTETEPEVS